MSNHILCVYDCRRQSAANERSFSVQLNVCDSFVHRKKKFLSHRCSSIMMMMMMREKWVDLLIEKDRHDRHCYSSPIIFFFKNMLNSTLVIHSDTCLPKPLSWQSTPLFIEAHFNSKTYNQPFLRLIYLIIISFFFNISAYSSLTVLFIAISWCRCRSIGSSFIICHI